MFIDASAIVAILARESDADRFKTAIDAAAKRITSPLAIFEASVSLAKAKTQSTGGAPAAERIAAAHAVVNAFIEANDVMIAPISAAIGDRAVAAAGAFGKFVGHPADLNFGDCFSYACAKALRMELVFKGEDFSKTDVNERVGR